MKKIIFSIIVVLLFLTVTISINSQERMDLQDNFSNEIIVNLQSEEKTLFLLALNQLPDVTIAGRNLKFIFGDDTWTAKYNGRDFLYGTFTFQITEETFVLLLKQTHTYIRGRQISTPGPDIVLEYIIGPPASLRLITQSSQDNEIELENLSKKESFSTVKFSIGNEFCFLQYNIVYFNNDSYNPLLFSFLSPSFNFRYLYTFKNNLQFGLGTDLTALLISSIIGGNIQILGDDFSSMLISFYSIIGYSNLYLHLGYDIWHGGLYVSPTWAITDHIFIGMPTSLFGSNRNPVSVASFLHPIDKGYAVIYYFKIGISFHYVF